MWCAFVTLVCTYTLVHVAQGVLGSASHLVK